MKKFKSLPGPRLVWTRMEGLEGETVSDDEFVEFVCEQLVELEGLRKRAMFGGFGLYLDDAFFGIVYYDTLYLKTYEATRSWYEQRGMTFFRPNEKQSFRTYFEVPADTIEDRETLVARCIEASLRRGRSG